MAIVSIHSRQASMLVMENSGCTFSAIHYETSWLIALALNPPNLLKDSSQVQ